MARDAGVHRRTAPDLARALRNTSPLDEPRALCATLGLVGRARRQALGLLIRCPAHDDRSPSCSVFRAKDGTVAAKCHGCGWTGDALGLVAAVHGLDVRRDFGRVLDEAGRLTGLDVLSPEEHRGAEPERPDDETYDAIWRFVLEACELRLAPDVAHYLHVRGIYADADAAGVRGLPREARPLVAELLATFERPHLESAGALRRGRKGLDWPAWPLLIPWRDRFGRIACVQRRRLDDVEPKYRFPSERAPTAPFGVEHLAVALDYLGPDAEVVIVEGAIECLSRRRIARYRDEHAAIIGVPSASTPRAGLPLDLLTGRRVLIALDADEAGDRACALLGFALRDVSRELVRARPIGAKDWNDALRGSA